VTARDEVAGLPGGTAKALAASAAPVYAARPGDVRDLATRLDDAAEKCQTSLTTVGGGTRELDGAWEGPSADGFVAYLTTFAAAADSVRGALGDAAGDLTTAAQALDDARGGLETVFSGLAGEARTTLAGLTGRPDGERAAAVDALAAQFTDRVTTQLTAASDALGTARTALVGRFDAISPSFTTMADPAAQPTGWVPAPRTLPTQVTPASTAPVTTQPAPASGAHHGGGGGGGATDHGGSDHGGGGYSGGLGSSGGPPAGPPPGDVDAWIRQAIEILRANGIPVTEDNIDEIWTIIQKESGGDPNAINLWDSNAAKGIPSKGLMQCIDPTFNAHALPGHTNIWNPVDNIIAGVRYTFDRYGGFEGHPGLRSMAGGGGYQGY
jgi:uncharacterized protein YukE